MRSRLANWRSPTRRTRSTIIGQGSSGPNATIIDQLSLDRVFQIVDGANVTFENLEITGGVAENDGAGEALEADGGGIMFGDLSSNNTTNTGTLTLWSSWR